MTIKKRGSTWWYVFCIKGVQYRGSCFTEKEKELFFIKERELNMECLHQEIMRQILSESNTNERV